MSHVIIDTSDYANLVILQNKNGTTHHFTTRKEAEQYAKKSGLWDNLHIIEIHGVIAL